LQNLRKSKKYQDDIEYAASSLKLLIYENIEKYFNGFKVSDEIRKYIKDIILDLYKTYGEKYKELNDQRLESDINLRR